MLLESYAVIIIIAATILLAFVKRFMMTFLLIIANIAVFFIVFVTPNAWDVFLELGLNPSNFATAGGPGTDGFYTLLTSMYLHSGIFHITFNMVWLVFIGLMLEERVGKASFSAVYFLSGIFGGLAFCAANGFSFAIVIGASGAIYGIFGMFVRLYPFEKIRIFFIELRAYVWFLIFLGLDMLFIFFPIMSFLTGPVAYVSHIGGLLVGFLLAPYIQRTITGKVSGISVRKAGIEKLEPLATTIGLKEMLENLKKEDDPAIQKTWLEKFVSESTCPDCNGKLILKRNSIYCPSGHIRIKL